MTSEALITDLIDRTKDILNRVQQFKDLNTQQLNQKPNADAWSILECIEHLNRYGDFYIPEIKGAIASAKHAQSPDFKSSMLGEYFAKSMLPKEKLNKMKTFKNMNPAGSNLTAAVLETFIQQQQQILNLLNAARKVSLVKTKTGISITKWIRLRLGDTFRVVIYHNLRHVEQAEACLVVNV